MIVLGVDPGVAVGWAVLEVTQRTRRWVSAGVLRAPAVNGKRSYSPPGEAEIVTLLRSVVVAHRPGVLALEAVSGHAYSIARSRDLIVASKVEQKIADHARLLFQLRIVPMSAPTWRRVVVGIRSPSDAAIARALRVLVPSMPRRSNAHERDAAGVALVVGLRHRA